MWKTIEICSTVARGKHKDAKRDEINRETLGVLKIRICFSETTHISCIKPDGDAQNAVLTEGVRKHLNIK
jgi:hypothetical protein